MLDTLRAVFSLLLGYGLLLMAQMDRDSSRMVGGGEGRARGPDGR